MKTIELTKNKTALVDDADYEWLNQWKWHALKSCVTFYAARRLPPNNNGKRTYQYMHRQILTLIDKSTVTDHIDHNGLNNQRNNLRTCSQQQNMMNYKVHKNTLKFKGVNKQKNSPKWRSSIHLNGKKVHLGYFTNPIEAALAYDESAKKHFGEFARVNF